MADTSHTGGIFLKLRVPLKYAAAAAAFFALCLAAAWFCRAPLLAKAAELAAGRAGFALVLSDELSVSLSEIETGRLRVHGEGFSVSLASASFRVSWGDLVKGRHWLVADVHGLSVSMSGGGEGGVPVFVMPSMYPLKTLEITGGNIAAGGGSISVGRLSASAGPGEAVLRALELEAGDTPVSASGSCSPGGCSVGGTAGPSESLPDTVRFDAEIFRSSAGFSAAMPAAGLRASGETGFDENWSATVSLSSAAYGVPGRCRGKGEGYDPASMSASASCFFRAGGFPVKVSVSAEKGEFSFSASASTDSASASASGTYLYTGGRLAAELDSSGDLLLPRGAAVRGFTLAVSVSGTAGDFSVSAGLSVATAAAPGFVAGPLTLSASAASGPPLSFQAALEAGSLAAGDLRVSSVSFKGGGSPAEHSFELTAAAPEGDLLLAGSGSYEGKWTGEVNSLEGLGLRLRRPFTAWVSTAGSGFSGLALAYGSGELDASADYSGGRFSSLEAEARGFEISAASAVLSQLSSVSGTLDASLSLSGPPGALEGGFSLRSSGISAEGVGIGRLNVAADLSGGRIVSREAWLETPGGRLESSFSVAPGDPGGKDYFTVVSSDTDVSFLSALMPGVEMKTALLSSDIRISRGSSSLEMEGGAELAAAGLTLTDFGLKFSTFDLSLRPAPGGDGVALSGFAGAERGWLEAEGALSPGGPDLRLRGSGVNFNFRYGIYGSAASAKLRVSGPWDAPLFAGDFGLSELNFDQERWDKAPASDGGPSSYGLDISVSIPRNAWYRSNAGTIEGRGNIDVKKEPLRPPFVIGLIESVRGSYSYLGKSFDVENARVNFSGRNPPDPDIYLLAAYEDRVNSLQVYFEMEGTMRYPKVRLYSEPPMEQRDIMSVMLTGRPLYSLYSNGAGSERSGGAGVSAEQAVAGYISGRAGLLVRDKLDLDVLNIRMTQERRADVTVGRYLTSDLFVSYGQTLGPRGEKRVNAEYSLSKYFSLEGKTSTEGVYSADLLFKFGIR
ncbi:MAG: translocation/assembly module TamB domain-containing protein [Elusimicrobiales bacterium]|nr:translocation/assembly module TamB domain-containing protein [Elusimicrobiales bacterium]